MYNWTSLYYVAVIKTTIINQQNNYKSTIVQLKNKAIMDICVQVFGWTYAFITLE